MKKHRGSYSHTGIVRYMKRLYHNNFIMDYEVYLDKGVWYSELRTYSKTSANLLFDGSSRKICEGKIFEFFRQAIESNEVYRYISNEYTIEPNFEDVLYSTREKNIGYHITNIENRENILAQGLLPNGKRDLDVVNASIHIDKMKPKSIPDWVVRHDAVYAHPEMINEMLMDPIRKNCDLYAIDINYDRCWVGSLGLGGFCLFSSDFSEDEQKQHIKNCRAWGRLYWNNSCSINDYISQTEEFIRKDKRYGLDEVLIMHKVTKDDIKLIGSWDNKGQFIPYESFKDCVKDKFLINNIWINTLENYRKGVR